MTTTKILTALAFLATTPAFAQGPAADTTRTSGASTPTAAHADHTDHAKCADSTAGPPTTKKALLYKPQVMQYVRHNDQRGVNVFETPKVAGASFTGVRYDWGAAFTQQFQGLGHRNAAAPKVATGSTVNQNQLIQMGHGFNNAVANLYLDAQLARGIRVSMTSYLSSRHHNETWVKDGYFLIDESPIDLAPLNEIMKLVTLKIGHFEINYGDAHFRRTDNGNAMFNPLVGNLLMDAFTTSVGSEVYLRKGGALAMAAMTNGEVRGTILNPVRRSPAFIGKLGLDRQVTTDLRVRLTGSAFSQVRSANQTLFSGDRAGARYYDVLENTTSTEAAQAWSGNFRLDLNEMHAQVINPFIKYRGLEFFGNFERARGRSATEQAAAAAPREFTQTAVEGTYRFLKDALYVSGRYNTAGGRFASTTKDASMKRTNVGGGWFLTPTVLLKGEWVNQKYLDFPTTDIRHGGQFKGFMVEGVVAF